MFTDYLYSQLMELAGGDVKYAKELLEKLTEKVNNEEEQQ